VRSWTSNPRFTYIPIFVICCFLREAIISSKAFTVINLPKLFFGCCVVVDTLSFQKWIHLVSEMEGQSVEREREIVQTRGVEWLRLLLLESS
jgi:hypothetical protein